MAHRSKKKSEQDWPIKAYKNLAFLNSAAARPIRILSEILEPSSRLHKYRIFDTVVFFGSARLLSPQDAKKNFQNLERQIQKTKKPGRALHQNYRIAQTMLKTSRYYDDAVQLAKKLSLWFKQLDKRQKHFVICSGGGPGVMEAANRGAQLAKAESIGLNISLPIEQFPNPYVSKKLSFDFHYFFIRKFWFFYLSKALVIFPGGFGTFDELFELLTLIQTEKTKKHMPIVLFGKEYWEQVINWDMMIQWGHISPRGHETVQNYR